MEATNLGAAIRAACLTFAVIVTIGGALLAWIAGVLYLVETYDRKKAGRAGYQPLGGTPPPGGTGAVTPCRPGLPATLNADVQPDGGLLVSIVAADGHTSIALSPEARLAFVRRVVADHGVRPELAILRDDVAAFALAMERRFRDFDDTKGWPPRFQHGRDGLFRQLLEEVGDLDAVSTTLDGGVLRALAPSLAAIERADLLTAAADVANLALLVVRFHNTAPVMAAPVVQAPGPERVQ